MTTWNEAAQRLDEYRPATDALLVQLVEGALNMREHDHQREDFYCLNLASYGGEKLPTVLRRLRDVERALEVLRQAAEQYIDTEHRDEARDAELRRNLGDACTDALYVLTVPARAS